MDTMISIGTRICQWCGEGFDIGYGGGKAKYCPDCRVKVYDERKRERARISRRKSKCRKRV